MTTLWAAFAEGIIAFVATNIDDILILLLFFSQVDDNFRKRYIIIGQYLGFSAIILASLPGFFGGLIVPHKVIGLLGLLPIAIGIKKLLSQEESTEVQTVTRDFKPFSSNHSLGSFLVSLLHPQTYKVAAVTLANGGDNISIYIPLFAGHSYISMSVILIVFFVMVGVWCTIANLLSRQEAIARILSRYGRVAVPFVLIGLGLLILYERGTIAWLYSYWRN
jgi:cadmium resistance transport/sequestration family protein